MEVETFFSPSFLADVIDQLNKHPLQLSSRLSYVIETRKFKKRKKEAGRKEEGRKGERKTEGRREGESKLVQSYHAARDPRFQ